MVGNQAVYADNDRIYLASFQGKLFVLARDRSANFPLLEVINTSVPLVGVRGDRHHLYVVDQNGILHVYRKGHPLVLVNTVPLSTFAASIALEGGNLYITTGGNVAVDEDHVYLSVPGSSENVHVLEFQTSRKGTVTAGLVYDATNDPDAVVVFDRTSGERETSIDRFGSNLYVDKKILVQTTPGCCGTGIFVYD
jgi:hypothetical protein